MGDWEGGVVRAETKSAVVFCCVILGLSERDVFPGPRFRGHLAER